MSSNTRVSWIKGRSLQYFLATSVLAKYKLGDNKLFKADIYCGCCKLRQHLFSLHIVNKISAQLHIFRKAKAN